jgi:hypothetical protein
VSIIAWCLTNKASECHHLYQDKRTVGDCSLSSKVGVDGYNRMGSKKYTSVGFVPRRC